MSSSRWKGLPASLPRRRRHGALPGYERQVKPVRAMLTGEAFGQAWDEGRAMSLDRAVRYALDEQAGRET